MVTLNTSFRSEKNYLLFTQKLKPQLAFLLVKIFLVASLTSVFSTTVTGQVVDEVIKVESIEDCNQLRIQSISPIIFQGRSECYVKAYPATNVEVNDIVAIDGYGDKYIGYLDKNSSSYVFPDLPNNESFSLHYVNRCGKNSKLGAFRTFYRSGHNINVSRSLYERTVALSTNKNLNPNTFDAILADPLIDENEKAYFFQRYFLKGKPVSSRQEIFKLGEFKSKRSCNCESVIHTFLINPGQLTDLGLPTAGTRGSVLQGPAQFEDDVNKLEFQLHTAGAAKAWWVYSDGWREKRNVPYGGAVGTNGGLVTDPQSFGALPNDFSAEARIGMNLFCNSGATPRDCGCDKLVRSRAMYESAIGVRSQTGSGGGVKRALAAGEDIAIAYLLKRDGTPTGDLEVFGGFINMAVDSCNASPNNEFWTSAFEATFGIASLIASFMLPSNTGPTSELFNMTRGQIIQNIEEDLSAVIATSPTVNTGDCSAQLQLNFPRRFDFQPDITISPNVPAEFGIATRSRLLSSGMRSWQSETTLASGFSLATVHPAGLASSDQDPGCCLDRTEVTYFSRAFDAGNPLENEIPPVSSQIDLMVDAATYIYTRTNQRFNFTLDSLGRYRTLHEYGEELGKEKWDYGKCLLKPNDEEYDGEHGGNFDQGPSPETKVSKNSTIKEVKIYTMDGKQIGNFINPRSTRRHQLSSIENLRLPSGIYILRTLFSNGHLSIEKILIN